MTGIGSGSLAATEDRNSPRTALELYVTVTTTTDPAPPDPARPRPGSGCFPDICLIIRDRPGVRPGVRPAHDILVRARTGPSASQDGHVARISEWKQSRELFVNLTQRELRGKYKRTFF